jgi:hypothetical protein
LVESGRRRIVGTTSGSYTGATDSTWGYEEDDMMMYLGTYTNIGFDEMVGFAKMIARIEAAIVFRLFLVRMRKHFMEFRPSKEIVMCGSCYHRRQLQHITKIRRGRKTRVR